MYQLYAATKNQVPLLLQLQRMPKQPNPPITLVSLPGTLTLSRGNLGETGGRKERKGAKKTKPEEKGEKQKRK